MGSTTGPGPSHPRIKRERGYVNNNNADGIIDLVDPGSNRVSIRVAENLAPNEELICDLTEDEDAPQWAKRQKPVIEIDDDT
jgi:hypothetical protein